MTTYFPALAKYFVSDANVWWKEFYIFHFVVAFVLQQGNIIYIENFICAYAEAYLEHNPTQLTEIISG